MQQHTAESVASALDVNAFQGRPDVLMQHISRQHELTQRLELLRQRELIDWHCLETEFRSANRDRQIVADHIDLDRLGRTFANDLQEAINGQKEWRAVALAIDHDADCLLCVGCIHHHATESGINFGEP
jgi:hypothetical protein